jgi:hypothetical protein
VEWSQAGSFTTLKAGGTWLPLGYARGSWPEEAVSKYGDSLYGDRRQEVVLIGNAMDENAIRESLNEAILTDEEYALGPDVWTSWTKLITEEALKDEDKSKDVEFIMHLVKKPGDRVGVIVDETEGVRIASINDNGLVSEWNKKNPESEVKVGYKIKDVNGVPGVDGMQLVGSSTELRMMISRLKTLIAQKRFP